MSWYMPEMANVVKVPLRFCKVGVVLMGHGLTVDEIDELSASRHDQFNRLVNVIEVYEDLGFEFISMEDLLEIACHDFVFEKNWVHITFDDGYESVYTRAYPYLREKQIPFSLFISTHHIESSERFYAYRVHCSVLNAKSQVRIPGLDWVLPVGASRQERIAFGLEAIKTLRGASKAEVADIVTYIDALQTPQQWEAINRLYPDDSPLSVDQVEELAEDMSVYIGSHNHSHISLNHKVLEKDVFFELNKSKEWLQKRLHRDPLAHAYPYGARNDFTPLSKSISMNLGYEMAFTSTTDFVSKNTDRYEVPRVGLSMTRHELQMRLLKSLLPQPVVNIFRSLKAAKASILAT